MRNWKHPRIDPSLKEEKIDFAKSEGWMYKIEIFIDTSRRGTVKVSIWSSIETSFHIDISHL